MTDVRQFDLKPRRPQQVYTLVVEIGRKAQDGLPPGATGAALMIYASGVDEAEAVRETVAILKQADLAPLDVTGYGTLDERLAGGDEIDAGERALMQRALDENSVIVAQMTPFLDESNADRQSVDTGPGPRVKKTVGHRPGKAVASPPGTTIARGRVAEAGVDSTPAAKVTIAKAPRQKPASQKPASQLARDQKPAAQKTAAPKTPGPKAVGKPARSGGKARHPRAGR